MSGLHRGLCLQIVATDRTFARALWQGREVWQGKCIHCQTHLLVALDGTLLGQASIEHILPQSHGGTDEPDNLAIACRRCNNTKGSRLDVLPQNHPKLMAVVEKLLLARARRRRRRL